MKVLYPTRIDTAGAMGVYHRNLASKISAETYGFVGPDASPKKYDRVNVIQLPTQPPVKFLKYLRAQLDTFDIIHTGPFVYQIPSLLSAKSKIVHTIHNAEDYGLMSPLTYHRELFKRFSDMLVFPSEYIRMEINGRSSSGEFTVIPNGVDNSFFYPEIATTQEGQALYVARDAPRKNPSFVFDLAELNEDWEFRFRISDLSDKLTRRGKRMENITLLPRLSKSELASEYSKATALLCPFEREGFGLVVIEALSCGTPVIALNSGNLPNLIQDFETGRILEDLDLAQWSASLQSTPLLSLEDRTRSVATQFDWKLISHQYMDLYSSL